jgi:hypothetical protein
MVMVAAWKLLTTRAFAQKGLSATMIVRGFNLRSTGASDAAVGDSDSFFGGERKRQSV